MSVDLGGLPAFPDTGALRAAAQGIRDAGKAISDRADEVKASWGDIQANGYITSDTLDMGTVYAAADPVVDYGDAGKSGARAVYLAIDAYCDAMDGLRGAYDSAVAGASACYADVADEQEAQAAVNAVAQQMADLEEQCAHHIRAVNPDTPYTPGQFAGPEAGATSAVVQEALEGHRVHRFTFDVVDTITVTSVRYTDLQIEFADGSRLRYTELDLTQTRVETRTTVVVAADLPNPPGWAKWGGRFLEGADVVLSAWGNYSEEWNQDLVENPGMTTAEQTGSAVKSATLGAGGSFLGSAGGAWGGAAAGAAVGTMVGGPVGTVVGGIIGGVAGGIAGGWGGEILGNTIDNWTDGEGFADGVKNAWNNFWGG
ncbi:hypothetical protein [Citricoccus zhacaiensis]|uniref:hypothetical protein n=1 Tax=Citricoccus zhacaiensis TaxID=489142 RepID=UPI003CE8842C